MARLKHPYKPAKRLPWSYRAGTTPLHFCPTGLKLVFLLLVSALPILGLHATAGAAVLIFLGALFANLTVRELFSGSRPLAIMLLLFTLFRAVRFGGGQLEMDLNAIKNGLYLATGILLCFAAASLFFAVTTTTEIRHSLSGIEYFFTRKQGRLSLGLALMLGFLPRFFECWENAVLAARARCCTGGIKRIITILPLVTERMIETAGETAEALESRGLEL